MFVMTGARVGEGVRGLGMVARVRWSEGSGGKRAGTRG